MSESTPDSGVMAFPVAADLPHRYASAARDLNPIHLSETAARQAGLEGTVLHGMCVLGWVGEAVESTLGAPVRHLQARFAAPVQPGDVVRVEVASVERADAPRWTAQATGRAEQAVLRAVKADRQALSAASSAEALVEMTSEVQLTEADHDALCGVLGRDPDRGPGIISGPVMSQPVVTALLDHAELGFGLDGSIHVAQRIDASGEITLDRPGLVSVKLVEDRTARGLRRLKLESEVSMAGAVVSQATWTLVKRLETPERLNSG